MVPLRMYSFMEILQSGRFINCSFPPGVLSDGFYSIGVFSGVSASIPVTIGLRTSIFVSVSIRVCVLLVFHFELIPLGVTRLP